MTTPIGARYNSKLQDGGEDMVSGICIPPQDMLFTFQDINIAAPMVRYSKLPFRRLVSLYDCHITHTPMILAAEFSRSSNARMSDFSTSRDERGTFALKPRWWSNLTALDQAPEELSANTANAQLVKGALIAQFAANDPQIFADAAELIHPYVDGIDLNCGCPQGWAYQEHIGSWLLRQPDSVRDLIRAARARVGAAYPISIKIRVDDDLRRTEQLVQTAIHSGANIITVHGRTRHQPSTVPVSLPSISFAVEAARGAVPVVANGDAWSKEEAQNIRAETKANGVMSARGLLANPALFSGHHCTPKEAVQKFVSISTDYGLLFPLFHRHLSYMLESQLSRSERIYFNSLVTGSYAGVIDYLDERGLGLPGGYLSKV